MSVAPLILLLGPRAAGKTTVGRRLAARLDRPFADLDDLVLARLGLGTVMAAWAALGEPAWREAEREVLLEALGRDGASVLALGGGAVLEDRSRRAVRAAAAEARAIAVYLRCDVEVVTGRLRREAGDRPSLTGGDPAGEAATVVAERDPVYRATADVVVDGSGEPDAVADRVLAAIRSPVRRGGRDGACD